MDGEVIDPLLRLFHEGVAIDFPGEFLGPAADFFQRLINRDGADGRRIANDPFAGGVNVFAGAEIITVSAPHFVAQRIFSTSSSIELATALLPMLALIFTRKLRPIIIGSDSGWLMLAGMIARPRATSVANEFGSDFVRDFGAERLAGMLLAQIVARNWGSRTRFAASAEAARRSPFRRSDSAFRIFLGWQ